MRRLSRSRADTTAVTSPGDAVLTAGLGGMGGAQPFAATMAGASLLAIECQASRIEMRLQTGYLDVRAADLDEALTHHRTGMRRAQTDIGWRCWGMLLNCCRSCCDVASVPMW